MNRLAPKPQNSLRAPQLPKKAKASQTGTVEATQQKLPPAHAKVFKSSAPPTTCPQAAETPPPRISTSCCHDFMCDQNAVAVISEKKHHFVPETWCTLRHCPWLSRRNVVYLQTWQILLLQHPPPLPHLWLIWKRFGFLLFMVHTLCLFHGATGP